MANKILEGAQESFENLTQTLDSTAKTYLSLEKIIPDVIDLFSQQASDVRMLNKELGNGSKLTAEFRKEIIDISKSIGIASRYTIHLVEATKEYHQGITDSTEATLKFQKASGVSMGIIGKFAAKVNILGNISAKTHDKMYENILAVRDAYGLTDEQIGDVVVSLTNYAVATQASDEQILKASVSLSKFTSLLTSAGIEADRVANILDSMLDPERMMDNVVLMNKMGITVNDMVSGDPTEKLEGSIDKLKQLGQEIANIAKTNRLQASEIAKVYNLTLQEAIQLSTLDTSEKALNTQKKLDEYRNETASLIESLGAFKESVIGYAASLINPWLEGFEKLEGKMGLMSKGLIGVGTLLVSKWVLGKFRDGILSLFGEAARKFSDDMLKYLGKVDERLAAKSADAAGLTPNRGKSIKQKYGWGLNYNAKAEARRNEYNRNRWAVKRSGNVDEGEIISSTQSRKDELNKLSIQLAGLKGAEKLAFEAKYGTQENIQNLIKKMDSIIDITRQSGGYSKTVQERKASYQNSKTEENKSKTAMHLVSGLLEEAEIDAAAFGIGNKDNNKKMADIISHSNNTKEALQGLYDFFKEKNMSEQVLMVKKAMEDLGDQAKLSTEQISEANKILKEVDRVAEGGGKTTPFVKLKSLWDGFTTNLGTFGRKVRDLIVSSPKLFLKGIGKGLKFGALGILGGIGVKFMASLSKNEKFQETMTTLSERITSIFDGLVTAVEPIIEPVSNAIMGIFNFIQPAINWLSKIIGKVANVLGNTLNKSVSDISKNVSTISDSYKQEDLKTMVAATALNYDDKNDTLIVQIGKLISTVENVSKKVDDGNTARILSGQKAG